MKRVTKAMMVFVMVMSTSGIFAMKEEKAERQLNVFSTGESNFKLVYESNKEEDVIIKVIDEANISVYNSTISGTSGFILPVKVTDGTSSKFKVVIYTEDAILKDEIDLSDIKGHRASLDLVRLTPSLNGMILYSGVFDKEPIKVAFYDRYQNLLFKEELEASKDFIKRYDLSKLEQDEVNVYVYHKGELVTSSSLVL